jgi:hypothetical protein
LKDNNNKLSQALILLLIAFITIALLSFYTIKNTRDKHAKAIILADYYCYNEQWTKAIEVILADDKYDFKMNFLYNRAINNSGLFAEKYFEYPQLLGGNALFPDKIKAANMTIICSDFYYDIGHVCQANHWAYEAQTSLPYCSRVLKRLVLTNLILGNYKTADNLLDILSKTFYNDKFVEKYKKYTTDTSLVSSDVTIIEKRSTIPYNEIDKAKIEAKYIDLFNANNSNIQALDHLEMYFLLTHQLNNFIEYLPKVIEIRKTLPPTYEEALLIYLVRTKQPNNLYYPISKNTQALFNHFGEILSKKYGNDKEAAKNELWNLYGNTYLYYMVYLSPVVTKLELKTREE